MVFARAPVPGRCKTRLARRYGARGAARLHRQLCDRTLTMAAASGFPVELWCEPSARHGYFQRCRRRYPGLRLRRQPAGDLGHKMTRALATVRRALLIGTDCALLDVQHLRRAAAALEHADCVLHPADDGGYVLIGARVPLGGALRGVSWSSGRELRQTRRKLLRRGWSCELREPLWDVDHPRDARRAAELGLLRLFRR